MLVKFTKRYVEEANVMEKYQKMVAWAMVQCVAKVIPIPQVNAGNINRGKAFGTCEDVDVDSLHPTVKRWFPKCKETSAVKHFLRVFYHLDKVMQQVIEQ